MLLAGLDQLLACSYEIRPPGRFGPLQILLDSNGRA
jgi:hypothetical protein